ncbi:MSMEG_1061 family FMN-dependent PPOX-type flavoprotein [Pseudonocardia pini]|uniref:MSMEG_1061 family FMN-dependent PPOX-type flavoprotein n=1 Tax=Pseudonocardia pini TaxID=2758030 RepID=UPI001FE33F53|nr:MSMEG_1061 family FMN-dependent PPOX-type flavoprotein [Pseudonocardia pini]
MDAATAQQDMRVISTLDELREVVPEPHPSLWEKDIGRIDPTARTFIETSPFLLLATSAPDGTCDVTPRGDPAGSVLVLDEHTIVIADRRGNRRLDGLRNVLANPHVGLLFVVPGRSDTLRVNGTAQVVSEAPFFDRLVVEGSRPVLALVVRVEELFLHCAKAFLRAGLWDPASWPDRAAVPSPGEMVRSMRDLDASVVPEIDAMLERDAAQNRY